MKPTIEEIALKADVSKSTVSRVLNNNPKISDKTRNHVLRIAQELHYFEGNQLEENGKVCLFLVANPNESVAQDEFFSSVFRGISYGCKKLGFHCMVETVRSGDEFDKNLLLMPSIKGIIVGGIPLDDSVSKAVSEVELPIVQIGKYSHLENKVSINNDNFRGGYIAGEKISSSKVKKTVILTGPVSVSTFKDRIDGFKKAVIENDRTLSVEVYEHNRFNEQAGYEMAEKVLKNIKPEDKISIFCTTDWIAKGAMTRIKEKGFKIPEDISLMGFGNLKFSEYLSPSLTTVSLNPYLLGRFAVSSLSDIIDGMNEITSTVYVEPNYVQRDSFRVEEKE